MGLPNFRKLYSDVISKNKSLIFQNGQFQQDISPEVQGVYVKHIPRTLQELIFPYYKVYPEHLLNPNKTNGIMTTIATDRAECKKVTLNGIRSIVRSSSTAQTMKGVATAGLKKSLVYSLQKLRKMARVVK